MMSVVRFLHRGKAPLIVYSRLEVVESNIARQVGSIIQSKWQAKNQKGTILDSFKNAIRNNTLMVLAIACIRKDDARWNG